MINFRTSLPFLPGRVRALQIAMCRVWLVRAISFDLKLSLMLAYWRAQPCAIDS